MSKREDIIRATAALMETRGYENTSIGDILDACAIGKGQFYHYFSSKHALGLAVVEYFFTSFERDLLQGILRSDLPPARKLDEMLKWIVAHHRARQAKCGCAFGNLALEMSERDEDFRLKLDHVFSKWEEGLRLTLGELLAASGFGPAETANLARAVVAMVEGGILLMKNKQDIGVLESMADWIRYLVASCARSGANGVPGPLTAAAYFEQRS